MIAKGASRLRCDSPEAVEKRVADDKDCCRAGKQLMGPHDRITAEATRELAIPANHKKF